MSKTKLLACPFCGNAMDESWHGQDPDGGGYARGCPNCKTWGPKAKTQKQADKLWNARAGGRKPAIPKTVGVKALESATGSTDGHEAEITRLKEINHIYWHALVDIKKWTDGLEAVWGDPGYRARAALKEVNP